MNRHRSGFVLGYHGCDGAVCEAILAGEEMKISARDYDWLGPGAYFWEADETRAMEWATERVAMGKYAKAAVVGAVIDLGNCLDLTVRSHLELLKDAHQSLVRAFKAAGKEPPRNKDIPSGAAAAEKPLRYLDYAVIEHLCSNVEANAAEQRARGEVPGIEPFDTIRGMFVEGAKLYEGGGFFSHSHSQIAVGSLSSIRGDFGRDRIS